MDKIFVLQNKDRSEEMRNKHFHVMRQDYFITKKICYTGKNPTLGDSGKRQKHFILRLCPYSLSRRDIILYLENN